MRCFKISQLGLYSKTSGAQDLVLGGDLVTFFLESVLATSPMLLGNAVDDYGPEIKLSLSFEAASLSMSSGKVR